MHKQKWPIVAVVGFLVSGCSLGLEGVGAGATAADDAARCEALASGMGLNLQVRQTNHFLVMSTVGSDSDSLIGRFLDQVADRFVGSFTEAGFSLTPPPDRLICVCLSSYGELDAYGRRADGTEASWMDGYYSYRTNRVAVVRLGAAGRGPGGGSSSPSAGIAAYAYSPEDAAVGEGLNLTTTTHELAHQLAFNSGLQRRDVTNPFWLTEGLATNFEADCSGSYGLARQVSRYRSRLAEVRARGRLMPLEQFVGMAEPPVGRDQALRDSYAQAWGLFHFLLQHRREQLKGYMSSLAASPGGRLDAGSLRRGFIDAFGPVESLERDFLRSIDGTPGGGTP